MKTLSVVLGTCFSITAAQAALYQFDISPPGTDVAVGLSWQNEVNTPTNSAGTGGEVSGGVVYDSDTGILHVAIGYGSAAGFTDLTAAASAAHIHGPAGPGTNAGVLIDFAPYHFRASDPSKGGVIVGEILFPEVQLTNLFNGLLYVNVHTPNWPGGEIRGQLIPVTPTNTAPALLCPASTVANCGDATTLTAVVSDEDGDALNVVWTINGAVVQTNSVAAGGPPSGATVSFTSALPVGTNIVVITVTDSATNSTTCTSTVTVADTQPPVIVSATANPASLWPVNHKMVPITITASVQDDCGTATWRIKSVTSNEHSNGKGDGNTAADWRITGDHTLALRAERSGKGNGRIYSITIVATDESGNTAERVVTVTVPKSQGKK